MRYGGPGKFVALLDDREAKGDPVTLPDGSVAEGLPGFQRWLWDGGFCGSTAHEFVDDYPSSLQIEHSFFRPCHSLLP
jgi:hypothetical protein